MATLDEIRKDSQVTGLVPGQVVTIISIDRHTDDAVTVAFRDDTGRLGEVLLSRSDAYRLEIVQSGRNWSFTADGDLLRLVSEAHRINLAHLFDPVLAVHTSLVDPLPHQITAVYEEMLSRQPLRFLLADDPGAGKTIMAGLLIKELLVRGDVQRCMIVAPGSLVEQWQDELRDKFQLHFEILTNDKLESSVSGNWFSENPRCICRLDKLSRNESLQQKMSLVDWDLVVVDEAHKMSASYFGGELKETKRFKLGKKLADSCRHFLLMSATPHNGKEEDFQLFLSLLDGDRFEGKFREGVHATVAGDIMRRMVKEQLVKFDETPLFPERKAYAVNYQLSDDEATLYSEVSEYVRKEFNRVEALNDNGRKGTVGFALTILQRRLASSPEAIYQSLKRRRERLESRLHEELLISRGQKTRLRTVDSLPALIDEDDIDDFEDQPGAEFEDAESSIADLASAAETTEELKIEIQILSELERLSNTVRLSGTDRKWEQLSSLLQDNEHMFDEHRHRRKLVIFTEHRDTLNYLTDRIRTLLGREDAVVTISGGMAREERKKAQSKFTQHPEVLVLIATDAAGEGINLQRAHLMVNYDLPWNPNRLEQRFGRIHRIGQKEVCHLWNLIASETREGDVFRRLLDKLEVERAALGGAVFDVLGQAIEGRQLRELMREAICYGNRPEVRERLFRKVDEALDHEKFRELINNRSLSHESMDTTRVRKIRENMERANARRLQPHFISTFFREAFVHLGGTIREREPRRYEIRRVPTSISQRDRLIGARESVLQRYERVTFSKDLVDVAGQPKAEFVCPGHPLLDSVIDLILEQNRHMLKQGAILIDSNDESEDPKALFYLEHSIQDARKNTDGSQRVISRQLQFVSIDSNDKVKSAGPAPYLDYRSATVQELEILNQGVVSEWTSRGLEDRAISHAISDLVPKHMQEIRLRRESLIEKTIEAVRDRLTKEIQHWDHQATQIKLREVAGKQSRMSAKKAQDRADSLEARLKRRLEELEQEKIITARPPIVVGGALVVPQGLLNKLQGITPDSNPANYCANAEARRRVELAAMKAVTDAEIALGNIPKDVSKDNVGYDIESTDGRTGHLRFLEVKGRHPDADSVSLTKNEVVCAVNSRESFFLVIVRVDGDNVADPVYVREPFDAEPGFAVTSQIYDIDLLLERGVSAQETITPVALKNSRLKKLIPKRTN